MADSQSSNQSNVCCQKFETCQQPCAPLVTMLRAEIERLRANYARVANAFWHPFIHQNPQFRPNDFTCHECGMLEEDPIHE